MKTLADRAGMSLRRLILQRVQRVIAVLTPNVRSDRSNGSSGWLGAIGDQVLTALLVYGYPGASA